MGKNEKVVVEWLGRGSYIKDGEAYQRTAGDQDIYRRGDCNGLVTSGLVKIVQRVGEIPVIGEDQS